MGEDKPRKWTEKSVPGAGDFVEQTNQDLAIREPTSAKKQAETSKQAGLDATMALEASAQEEANKERKRRNSIFQTEGGSSGMEVMNVAQRGTIFGN